MAQTNLNRIELITDSYCKGLITAEQMANLINKYGIEEEKEAV